MRPRTGSGRSQSVLFGALAVLTVAALIAALMIGGSAHIHTIYSGVPEAKTLAEATFETADGRSGKIRLPGSIADIAPRSHVTVRMALDAAVQTHLMIKTVYTGVQVYADDALIYTIGEEGSFPAFLIDPPTIISIVPLPEGGAQSLRFEYVSPSQRSVMALPAVLVGDTSALFLSILEPNAFSLLFSLLLILIGVLMILAAATLFRGLPKGSAFVWQGLFSLSVGTWFLGECDLTAFILPSPGLLYLIAFIGLFTMVIPLLKYGLVVIKPKHPLVMRVMMIVLLLCAIAAFALQAAGLVGMSRSMYLFHILDSLGILVFVGYLAVEAARYKNRIALRFVWPVAAVAVAAVLEVVNYSVRFTETLSLFFQIGMLVFVLWMGGLGASFSRDVMRADEENKRLQLEIDATGRQLQLQREQYGMLTDGIETTKKARHDMRHHFAALKSYADMKDFTEMQAYLSKLIDTVPTDTEIALCENPSVNAVVNYYTAKAEQLGIAVKTALCVPKDTGVVLDTDLCVLFGNLLENAIEACGSLTHERFIHLRANIQGDYFAISVDNGFDGNWRGTGGMFYSRKRGYSGAGVGLSSIQAIAKKYNGFAEFCVNENVFEASVVVCLFADPPPASASAATIAY